MKRVERLDFYTSYDNTLSASQYLELPSPLNSCRSLINVRNIDDNYCMVWSILASRHHKDAADPTDPDEYRDRFSTINTKGIDFPLRLEDVPKLESRNKIRINLIGWDAERKKLFPIYLNKDDIINDEEKRQRELVEVRR